MRFLKLEKVNDGKYLKNYELTYLNKGGREKKYEIVTRKDLNTVEDLGQAISGVSVIATMDNKLLLLHEFRMSINKRIYNLCAGMIDDGEGIEDCICRELYEETGLKVKQIDQILPPSYSAVGISDVKTYIAFVEVEGSLMDHSSENEDIQAGFYTKDEILQMLQEEDFSSRAQMAAYFFVRDPYNTKK